VFAAISLVVAFATSFGIFFLGQVLLASTHATASLSLIAQGRSNAAIASTLFISPKVVEKHVANIFDKLGLAPDDDDNRRVIAALRYLES
jgi:DNA-binding NarL/FixJ family response regulator